MNDSKPTEDRRAPQEVRLRQETIDHLAEKMAEAVTAGIAEAITNLESQATQRVGGFVLGGVAGLIKRAVIFLMLGSIVYAVGGWEGLAVMFKKFVLGAA